MHAAYSVLMEYFLPGSCIASAFLGFEHGYVYTLYIWLSIWTESCGCGVFRNEEGIQLASWLTWYLLDVTEMHVTLKARPQMVSLGI
jgi:hypothetical protein